MASRSLNKVTLIGNLTRDPELRFTPQGTAVCSFGLATNRYWTTESGEKKEETEFHRIVAWNKLAELCSQLLQKGRKVYVEGRLQTRNWTGNDNVAHSTTEIVIEDMILLDSRRTLDGGVPTATASTSEGPTAATTLSPVSGMQGAADTGVSPAVSDTGSKTAVKKKKDDEQPSSSDKPNLPEEKSGSSDKSNLPSEDINPDDIPF
ncbi:single-stranded DNA-binding protein [Candidatus Microgenomates bacterium]|nr:single-stranded DNA-binding protein [Candidatus Microgenomates bacterium]